MVARVDRVVIEGQRLSPDLPASLVGPSGHRPASGAGRGRGQSVGEGGAGRGELCGQGPASGAQLHGAVSDLIGSSQPLSPLPVMYPAVVLLLLLLVEQAGEKV